MSSHRPYHDAPLTHPLTTLTASYDRRNRRQGKSLGEATIRGVPLIFLRRDVPWSGS